MTYELPSHDRVPAARHVDQLVQEKQVRTNLGYLQLVDKFAREALADAVKRRTLEGFTCDITDAQLAELERKACEARQAYARAASELPRVGSRFA